MLATDQDVDKLIPVMIELRPHRSPAELREMILAQMKNGYQVVYAGDEVQAFAVGGFRTIDFLFSGKTLDADEMDDSICERP